MVDFEVSYIGDNPQDMRDTLSEINLAARRRTNQALLETAREVKSDLEETAPVDTGEYKKSWYIVQIDYNEVWILNEADHAKYVMMPNSKMIGSTAADLPSMGILHNVKGVARSHQSTLNSRMAEELKDMIESFRISI